MLRALRVDLLSKPMPADTHLDLISKSRLEALSDGIYAIAMTLLVLELRLPPLPHGAAEPAMRAALIELLPKGLTWLLSFAVMASFWVSQQRIFTLATRLDRTMLRLELVQLALIALLPFTTALMGDHGSYVIVSALYAGHLLAMGLLSWLRAAHGTCCFAARSCMRRIHSAFGRGGRRTAAHRLGAGNLRRARGRVGLLLATLEHVGDAADDSDRPIGAPRRLSVRTALVRFAFCS